MNFESNPKQIIFTKGIILEEIIVFGGSLMPVHQLIEKGEKIAKRHVLSEVEVNFFDFLCFRSGLDFSKRSEYSKEKQNHKVKECVEMLEKKWMPLGTYTWMHSEAKMADEERGDMTAYFKNLQ